MQGESDARPNGWMEKLWEERAPYVLKLAAMGPECFDCKYYMQQNPDLLEMSCWESFFHFMAHGQFDERPHRCAAAHPPRPMRCRPV